MEAQLERGFINTDDAVGTISHRLRHLGLELVLSSQELVCLFEHGRGGVRVLTRGTGDEKPADGALLESKQKRARLTSRLLRGRRGEVPRTI